MVRIKTQRTRSLCLFFETTTIHSSAVSKSGCRLFSFKYRRQTPKIKNTFVKHLQSSSCSVYSIYRGSGAQAKSTASMWRPSTRGGGGGGGRRGGVAMGNEGGDHDDDNDDDDDEVDRVALVRKR
jgi:hypothetical protein